MHTGTAAGAEGERRRPRHPACSSLPASAAPPGPVPIRGMNQTRPVVPPGRSGAFRPEHLYKGIGLFFLLLLLYRLFDAVTQVLLLSFAAAILAIALNRVVERLPGDRRWVSALLGLVIFAGLGLLLWLAIPHLASQFRGLLEQLPAVERQLEEWERQVAEMTGMRVELVGEQARGYLRELVPLPGDGEGLSRARGILEILVFPLLILFGGLFAVGKPNDRLLVPLLRAVPEERRPAFRRILDLLGTRLWAWVRGVLISMALVGVVSTLAFYLIGLRYALLLGVWNGLVEVVPLLGPIVGGATAIAAALLESPDLAVWTAIVVVGIQQVESHLITPLVMAKVAEVHPFITLFAILLFGTVFGFLGVLLALPLVLLIWTLFQVLWVERAIHSDDERIEPVVED